MADSSEPRFKLHHDSSQLWTQLKDKGISPQLRAELDVLDGYQEREFISPFLADTVRDMIFQVAMEQPEWVNDLVGKSIGMGVKYMVNQLEGEGGYRLIKSAELISKGSDGVTDPGKILTEYANWQTKDEDDSDTR